jgi:uncharacterized membrane protein (UPF0127 family)
MKSLFFIGSLIVAFALLINWGTQYVALNPHVLEQVASSTEQLSSSTISSLIDKVSSGQKTTTIYTASSSVKAFVADTDELRERGLSGSEQLLPGVGMLFVFDKPGKYGFWMKDMAYPIDIIWINEAKRVVGVTKNVLPSSYPFVFMPPSPVMYVLEMATSSVQTFGLTTGTALTF